MASQSEPLLNRTEAGGTGSFGLTAFCNLSKRRGASISGGGLGRRIRTFFLTPSTEFDFQQGTRDVFTHMAPFKWIRSRDVASRRRLVERDVMSCELQGD